MIIHSDRHLNIFWPYGKTAHLENNITKAFINTFDTLSNKEKCETLKEIAKIDLLPDSGTTFNYFLQRRPNDFPDCINGLEKEKRIMIALSPTGDIWDEYILKSCSQENLTDGVNIGIDIDKIIEQLKDESGELSQEKKEILNEINVRGDSIPDAWIMVYYNNVLVYCVIIENKLYDLNPYQLRNHAEKSLLLNDEDIPNCYRKVKFETLYRLLYKYSTSNNLVVHFLEYVSLLNYEPLISFNEMDFEAVKTSVDIEKEKYRNLLKNKLYRHLNCLIESDFEKLHYDRYNHRLSQENINNRFNLFFDFNSENYILSISSEIGVKYKNTNQNVIPKIINNKDYYNDINNIYGESSYYVRYLRLNKYSQSLYFWIKECSTFKEYLTTINKNEIYVSEVTKGDCIKLIENCDSIGKEKLLRYNHQTWNKLEYLRIIDEIDISKYCNKDKQLYCDITKVIEKHITGINEFEKIYQSTK